MSGSLLQKFCEASIYRQSVPVSTQELSGLCQSINNEISQAPQGNFICLLRAGEGLDFSLKYLGLLDAGFIPLPLAKENFSQICELYSEKEPGLLIWDEGSLKVVGQPRPQEYSDCYACLTSGTTSIPKICFLSVEGARENAKSHYQSLGLSSEHTLLQSLPLYHSFGLVTYLWTVLESGCGIDLFPVFLGLKAMRKVKTKNQVLAISPGQLRFMLKERIEDVSILKDLQIISIGGGLADHAEIIKLKTKIPHVDIFVTYGLTEAGPRTLTGKWQEDQNNGFIGSAMEGIDVKILFENDELRDQGEGILAVKGPSLKLNLAEDELCEGFLITRDKVKLSESGNVHFISRGDDLIKVGGISVYPQDIESMCRQMPAVKDCLVLKKEDKLYGEIPLLFIEGEVGEKEVIDFLKIRLSVYQMPKKVYIYAEFPRHSLQKINRKMLLKRNLSE